MRLAFARRSCMVSVRRSRLALGFAALAAALSFAVPASAEEGSSEPPRAPLDVDARERLERDLSRLVAGPELAFCHDATEAMRRANREVCRVVLTNARQRCPAMARACSAHFAELESNGSDEARFGQVPGALGSILFWGALVLLGAAVLRFLWPLLESLAPAPDVVQKPSAGPSPTEPTTPRPPQESDVERLLAQAERARNEGRFEHAVAALYGALVHFLGREQLITVEPARTNGDYLRELSPQPELAASVRQAFRSVERVQFGHSEATAELCSELWSRILPIVKGGVALLALVLLPHTLIGCGPRASLNPESLPNGHHLLTKLLRERGREVRHLALSTGEVDDDVSQLLVFGRDTSPEVWSTVLAWAEEGGSVIVTEPSEELTRALHVDREGSFACTHALELAPRALAQSLTVIDAGARRLRLPDAPGSKSAPRVEASCDGSARIATFHYGEGYVTVLANPELFGNISLTVGDNAAFVLELFGPPRGALGLVGSWTGGGVTSPLRALQNAGLSALMLELLVVLLVFFWHRGAAFGIPRDPSDLARRAFADHVRALGRSYARAKANRHALSQYAGFALEVLRERFGRGAPLSLIDLAGEVARRTGEREGEVMRLLTEAHEAAQDPGPDHGHPADLQTIEKLETLLYPSGGPQ
ncbi:MAG TPA: DUF4350 domain-containing protein [Polyangiaceae bacterium]|nr:DUF4350 domain-containing protein [Polyangiaceae bacterium]